LPRPKRENRCNVDQVRDADSLSRDSDAAYFYPEGDQARREALLPPQPSDGLAYQVCVDHNKIGLDGTAVAPTGRRKRDRAAMCPDCFMVHAGECP